MILFDNIFLDLIVIIVVFIVSIYGYFLKAFGYWEKKGVPTVTPIFPYGNIKDLVRGEGKQLGFVLKDLYDELKSNNHKYGGLYLFSSPVFMPIERQLIKEIMATSFKSFHDRGLFYDENYDPVSAHLFALAGDKWTNLRRMLSPTFSSGKIKAMFQTVLECGNEFDPFFDDLLKRDEPVDIKKVSARYTTDIIMSCAFGLEGNCLKNFKEPNAFLDIGHKIIHNPDPIGKVKYLFMSGMPNLARKLKMKMDKTNSNFFMNLAVDTVKYREENNVDRKDFLQLMIQLKQKGELEDDGESKKNTEKSISKMTIEQIAAQFFIFFLGGFETSSTTMSFLLYEVSKNQSIQDKLRHEINTVLQKNNGQLTYEALHEMTYLDRVVNETLRKYPALPFLNRECTQRFKVPNTDIFIEKGTQVFVPVYALQHDPEYFPNPEEFNPDRFEKDIPDYAYIPFGEGPRICIGLRFGLVQTKVGIITLLKKYKFNVNPKSQTFKYLAGSFLLGTVDPLWLDVAYV